MTASPDVRRRTVWCVGVTVALGAVVLLLAVLRRGDTPTFWQFAVAILLVAMSELLRLPLWHRGERLSVGWGEAAVLVSCGLVQAPWLVMAAFLGQVLAHAIVRKPLIKAAFNVADFTAATAVVALLVPWSGNLEELAKPSHLPWLVLGGLAFSLLTAVAVSAVVAASTGSSWRQAMGSSNGIRLLTTLGNVVFAAAVVWLAWWSPRSLIVLPPVIIALHIIYTGYQRLQQDRDAWRMLDAANGDLNRGDEEQVVRAALAWAERMFRTSGATLWLRDDPAATPRMLDGAGSHGAGAGSGGAGSDAAVVDWVSWRREVGEATHAVRGAPTDLVSGAREMLKMRGTVLGMLEIALPPDEALTERERHLLTAFADAVSSHLMTARLLTRRVHEATHDGLTGLANRTLLLRRCEIALEQRAGGEMVALLLLDLDRFKQVNDTLGHAAGDTLLQQVASRLTGQVRREDLVARLGGDEFGVLLTGLEESADAETIADSLLGALREPFLLEGLRVSVGGSIGVAVCPLDAEHVEGLLRNADLAMYEAKVRPGSTSRYRGERDRGSAERLVMLTELQKAVDQADLMLYYQPKVTLGTGRTVGYEALVRWQHPRRGLLWPTHIVPVVEQSPLVRDFTLRVLDMACAAAAELGAQDPIEPPTMAVNLSARNLMDARLITDVMDTLDRHDIAPSRLILEITETVIVSELEVVEQVLTGLRSRGVQLSVDDFGTGFSSLAFLQRFAVNEIKVDRRFVQGIAADAGDAAIVRSTVHLAAGLGVRVVAEGVEDVEQLRRLRDYGCDLGQGYLLGRPVPLHQLLRPAEAAV
jgi:diguanylate cyclase (GGDEF)-like protein